MYFLGSITGASGSSSNQQTGASGIGTFAIPPGTKALYLIPSASGVQFELGQGASFLTSIVRGAPLVAGINGPFRLPQVPSSSPAVPAVPSNSPTVSIYTNAAGVVSCRVYAAPTS